MGEVEAAEHKLIKLIQKEEFFKYTLFIRKADRLSYTNIILYGLYLENDIIKCGGRIQLANVPESTKHPILLPGYHHMTNLLIQRCHEQNYHYSTNFIMAYMRQK